MFSDIRSFESFFERLGGEPPVVERVGHARLGETASELAGTEVTVGPSNVLMELSARQPHDAAHGQLDVSESAGWFTTQNTIYMYPVVYGPAVGEWNGTNVAVEFRTPADGTYLFVGHFSGYQMTMHLLGPWGETTAYTAETSDAGAVLALHITDKPLWFGFRCTEPNNEGAAGLLHSIQVYQLP